MTNSNRRQRQFPNTISTTAFVKLYMLHLLNEKECYGNEMKDEIEGRLSNKWSPSPGMIYPLLRDMEKEGYIKGHWDEPDRRSIKRYRITDAGIEHYKVLLRNYKGSFKDSQFIIETVLREFYGE